ncbi:bifunctional aldolase/short-chain dehydrogenase [Brevundimonas sp. 2R-24]|uniref:Bifunctional aldolase/short-chain dehydrogenase n=1 Tax=Peiella sedimenti TaxID=3061083 RepID=A0ABT8SN17_9CAUL|nr:bifunctional aldolase/short-chain dehydrogenase [Caulobacteraceae bacterium XZ-24]
MQSRWNDADARQMIEHYAKQGFAEDVALRVYTSRLLGNDPELVQHGGGNTSLKTTDTDITGETIEVIRVKGSGWDLGDIEPAGLPAMRLDSLTRLTAVPEMSDEAMVNAQRGALLDSASPNPSVETLLHAWIPHKVIDHTHANAVLALTDQPDGEALAREVYGDRMAICRYVMPGFGLAHVARETFEANPDAEGMILLKHGIFTWGADARQAYERMIEMVTLAERKLAASPRPAETAPEADEAAARALAPILRGALAIRSADGSAKRFVLDRRATPEVMAYLARPEIERFSQSGPATPDHVLRIKPWPMVLPDLTGKSADEMAAAVETALADYQARYRAYFDRNNARVGGDRKALDPMPRAILAPGVGLFGVGAKASDALIAADVAETNVKVISLAEASSRFESIPEADVFDVEYWSLEQAKLGKAKPARLAGQVAVVTGGASGIGAATAKALAVQGAEVVVMDRDLEGAKAVAKSIKGRAVACDVTDDASVKAAFDQVVDQLGGVDIVVSNAGAAWSGRIGEVDDAVLRQSFELNFFGHQRVAQAAVRVMRAQGTGGLLLFNVSKQAVNPGPDFGPYGLPKAALMALVRQYAVDYGAEGVRSNGVNADRIRSGLLTDEMIAKRSTARGLSEKDYMGGNLLGQEVRAEDVADAFVSLALAERTTGAILTVDGGNIAAALR